MLNKCSSNLLSMCIINIYLVIILTLILGLLTIKCGVLVFVWHKWLRTTLNWWNSSSICIYQFLLPIIRIGSFPITWLMKRSTESIFILTCPFLAKRLINNWFIRANGSVLLCFHTLLAYYSNSLLLLIQIKPIAIC